MTAQERFDKAMRHKVDGEYDEAEELFQSVLAEQPNNSSAWYELGITYSMRVKMDESMDALEKAVRLAPNSINVLVNYGKVLTMFGEYDRAKPLFVKVLELDPFNDEAQKNLEFIG
jgi:cytochrome c-type biogenesis protein CcmH/NrfG